MIDRIWRMFRDLWRGNFYQYGGNDCDGSSEESRTCEKKECPSE